MRILHVFPEDGPTWSKHWHLLWWKLCADFVFVVGSVLLFPVYLLVSVLWRLMYMWRYQNWSLECWYGAQIIVSGDCCLRWNYRGKNELRIPGSAAHVTAKWQRSPHNMPYEAHKGNRGIGYLLLTWAAGGSMGSTPCHGRFTPPPVNSPDTHFSGCWWVTG